MFPEQSVSRKKRSVFCSFVFQALFARGNVILFVRAPHSFTMFAPSVNTCVRRFCAGHSCLVPRISPCHRVQQICILHSWLLETSITEAFIIDIRLSVSVNNRPSGSPLCSHERAFPRKSFGMDG